MIERTDSERITRAFADQSVQFRDSEFRRLRGILDAAPECDLGFSGDVLAQLRAADRPSPAMLKFWSGAR